MGGRHNGIVMALALLCAAAAPARAELSYQDVLKLPAPAADVRIAYGPAPSQVVELWRPKGPGPFPVVLMIHGGCWRADLPGLELMRPAAADLRRRGIAVWNIEYRRANEPGGGYPGAFADVAQAADLLRADAPGYGLKLEHVVALGHSAGGHLALWAAARRRLPRSSPLWTADPLRIDAVVSLGGFSDLRRQHDAVASACGKGVIEALVGRPGPGRPDVYADTSPAELLPLAVRQVLIHGAWDPISPPAIDLDYARRAAGLGDKVERRIIPDAGHFELIAPGASAWPKVAGLVDELSR